MKRLTAISMLAATLFFAVHLTNSASPLPRQSPEIQMFAWGHVVLAKTGLSPEEQTVADEFGQFLIGLPTVQTAERNPVCCLWIETGWRPNPSEPGFLFVLQRGGGILMATDADQLREALAVLKGVSQKEGKRIKVPQGVLTNLPVVTTKKDQ